MNVGKEMGRGLASEVAVEFFPVAAMGWSGSDG